LNAEGTSYQAIVNDVRNHLARQYLADTDLSVADIGTLIGFEDLSNFRHAFRRWNGVSPSRFRRERGKSEE
jgi:AraC-like DNA-binding protein